MLTPHEAALGLPDVRQWPFDAARVRLAYGEQLRRAHATAAARAQLIAAHGAFEQLGAEPWTAPHSSGASRRGQQQGRLRHRADLAGVRDRRTGGGQADEQTDR